MYFSLIISVTIGRPVTFLAEASRSRPSALSPWKEYGDVRGLKAPPRRNLAPDFFTLRAISHICPSLSTEHGPAMSVSPPPPIFCPPGRVTTVSSGWNLRLAFLYGSCTRLTLSTKSCAATRSVSMAEVSPISPNTVLCVPTHLLTFTLYCFSSICENSAVRSSEHPCFNTIIIF